jgi:hypothetical protein
MDEARANPGAVLPPAVVGLGYYLSSLSKNSRKFAE